MDKKLLTILGIFGIVLIGIVFMLTILINQTKKENLPYCYVDVWHIAESYVIDKALSKQEIKNNILIKNLTEKIKQLTNNPYRYGCKAIFMKGAILSEARDITEVIKKELK